MSAGVPQSEATIKRDEVRGATGCVARQLRLPLLICSVLNPLKKLLSDLLPLKFRLHGELTEVPNVVPVVPFGLSLIAAMIVV